MRLSIITSFLLLFASSFLGAQSAPAPVPGTLLEDDLKLGIYDNPIFQPAARNFIVRQAEGNSKDGELLFVLGEGPVGPQLIRTSPSIIRLHMACRQHADQEDAMAVVYELLSIRKASRVEIVVHN